PRASARANVANLSGLWQSSSGSRGWAPRRTRSTASSRPTRARRVTAGSSRSSVATTRRPSPRRSSSTRRRSRTGSARAHSPPRPSRACSRSRASRPSGRVARVPRARAGRRAGGGARGDRGARGRARPAPARRPRRRRQGDRARRPDRASAPHRRACERRARGPARARRDRGLKLAALYDVHGMPWALEAVLRELDEEDVRLVVYGGDLLDGPFPDRAYALARSVEFSFVRGNCERVPSDWDRKLLSEDDLWFLAQQPLTQSFD